MAIVEIWFPVPGFPRYEFNDRKKVRIIETKRVLVQALAWGGYPRVQLRRNGKRHSVVMHRIVAKSRIPNPDNLPEVNHKNGIKTDYDVDNLEWVTRQQNVQHAHDVGLASTEKATV